MLEILVKVWYMLVVLPFILFTESTRMFSNFLKKKKIYQRWDVLHSIVVVLIIIFIILLAKGTR